jgi:Peptidase A4 family
MSSRLSLPLLAAAAAISVAAAPSSAARGTSRAAHGSVVSPSWSGYVATAPAGRPITFRSAAASWRVPSVRCDGAKARQTSAIWVGLGGFVTQPGKVEQIGVDAGCDQAGKPIYDAWFEVVPYPAYPLGKPVVAGDLVSALVEISGGWVDLRLADRTRGWSASRRITWPLPDTSSAEWIVEAPGTCIRSQCVEASLADFGALTMRGIRASGRGASGTLADSAWKVTAVRLVPGHLTGSLGLEEPGMETAASTATAAPAGPTGTPAGATPGPISPDGSSFTIRWLRNAADA